MPQYPNADMDRQAAGCGCAARIAYVEPYSPADDAGFEPGCLVTSVDGQPVRDIIDWRWLTAEDQIDLGYVDLDGDAGVVTLERDPGQDWGFEFEGVVFDRIKLCRNACTFCFMRQLPEGLRPSLTLRDDDFRLSFLSGTFVTLTNLSSDDERRIIEQRISPLRVSLHATDAEVRRRIIGKHAGHGLAAMERLLDAGIQMHAQIVLMPDENDGDVLERSLTWAYEHPGMLNVGIVPLGYTRFQDRFDRSFNDPADARAVLDLIRPFQERAMAERGNPWVFAADEFYANAFGEQLLEQLPPASWYDDFSMFEDGIGIIRSFADDFRAAVDDGTAGAFAEALRSRGQRLVLAVGEATRDFLSPLVREAVIEDVLEPLYVPNVFFGGNVDVTGLLTGGDVAAAVRARAAAARAGEPELVFALMQVCLNDDLVMLDGMTVEQVEEHAGRPVHVVCCNASEFMRQIAGLGASE
ncbi:MAG: DUF512 domain-containing protein [Coriobacteriia bacterium]|nr:DUF512 domain-containing protein [Coriobacteriia bacterium]